MISLLPSHFVVKNERTSATDMTSHVEHAHDPTEEDMPRSNVCSITPCWGILPSSSLDEVCVTLKSLSCPRTKSFRDRHSHFFEICHSLHRSTNSMFSYDPASPVGPDNWADLVITNKTNQCGGMKQSGINIPTGACNEMNADYKFAVRQNFP
jgi:hypothetical protein